MKPTSHLFIGNDEFCGECERPRNHTVHAVKTEGRRVITGRTAEGQVAIQPSIPGGPESEPQPAIICPAGPLDRFYGMTFSAEQIRLYKEHGVCPLCNINHQTEFTNIKTLTCPDIECTNFGLHYHYHPKLRGPYGSRIVRHETARNITPCPLRQL